MATLVRRLRLCCSFLAIAITSLSVHAVSSDSVAALNEAYAAGDRDGALARAAALFEAAAGAPRTPEWVEQLTQLARWLADVGNAKDSLRVAREAWDGAVDVLGPRHQLTLAAQAQWLDVLPNTGGFDTTAIETARDAVSAHREVFGADSLETATALVNLARVLNAAGQANAALKPLAEALAVRSRRLGETHADTQFCRKSMAVLLTNVGRPGEALQQLDALRPVVQAEGQPQDLAVLDLHRGTSLIQMGQNDAALGVLESALSVAQSTLGAQNASTLELQFALGDAQLRTGRMRRALVILEGALTTARQALGEEASTTLKMGHTLGGVLLQTGQPSEAAALLATVVAAQTRRYGPTHPNSVVFLGAWGHALCRAGQRRDGLAHLRQAVDLGSGPSLRISVQMQVRRNLLECLLSAGQLDEADTIAQDLVNQSERGLGPRHPTTLLARQSLADLLEARQQYLAASPLRQALAEDLQESLGRQHPATLRALNDLAVLHSRLGHWREALTKFTELTPDLEAYRAAIGPWHIYEQRDSLQVFDDGQRWHALAHLASGQERHALETLERVRSRALLDRINDRHASLAGALPESIRQSLEQEELKASLAAERARSAQGESAKRAALDNMRDSRQRLAQLQDRLRKDFPEYARLSSPPPLPDFRGVTLRSGDLVLDLLVLPDGQAWAATWAAGRALRWWPLGNTQGLATTLQTWQQAIQAQGHRFAVDEQGRRLAFVRRDDGVNGARWWLERIERQAEEYSASRSPAAALVEIGNDLAAMWPFALRRELAEARRLVVVPDGPFLAMPWALLTTAIRASRQAPEALVVPSLATMPAMPPTGQRSRAMLAISSAEGPAALPAADDEARQAGSMFANQGSLVLTGPSASEEALRALSTQGELRRFRRLHVAAHGRFDRDSQFKGVISLGRTGPDPANDGELSLAEWATLVLDSDLVTLSACDAGQGIHTHGEGLVGFGYALMMAGNRQTLAPLWATDDEASRDFMLRFLGHLKLGRGASTALAVTQAEFRRHPVRRWRQLRHWAGYTLFGSLDL